MGTKTRPETAVSRATEFYGLATTQEAQKIAASEGRAVTFEDITRIVGEHNRVADTRVARLLREPFADPSDAMESVVYDGV